MTEPDSSTFHSVGVKRKRGEKPWRREEGERKGGEREKREYRGGVKRERIRISTEGGTAQPEV